MVSNYPLAVYYAINNDRKYLSYTAISIESLLEVNNNIKIFLFIYGSLEDLDLSFFIENNIMIINKEQVRNEYFTSLKWFSLRDLVNIKEDRLLFADADTYFFKDIEPLFDICSESDFYAREEAGTEGNKEEYTIGQHSFKSNVNHKSFDNMRRFFKSNPLPVFNTGVMLFNNNIFKKIPEQLIFYESVLKSFIEKKIPYPSINSHVIDELVSSLMLGKLKNFKYEILSNEISPWFLEFKEKVVEDTGIVMHIWDFYYADFWVEPEILKFRQKH